MTNKSFLKNRIFIFLLLLSFTACQKSKGRGVDGHLLIVAQKDSLFGIWDITGKEWFISNKYSYIFPFQEGRAGFKKNNKWGFLDTAGTEIIPAKYEEINDFREGFAYVRTDHEWIIIDKKGNEIVRTSFDRIGSFHEGFYEVQMGTSYNFADTKGKVLYLPWFSYTSFFSGGYASGGKQLSTQSFIDCIIDKNGRVNWTDSMFYNIFPFQGHIARATSTKDHRNVIIDTAGRLLYTAPHLWTKLHKGSQEGEPFVILETEINYRSKYGMINSRGDLALDTIYDDLHMAAAGLVAVKKNDQWGLIDTAGRLVLDPALKFIGGFNSQLAMASADGKKFGYIDKTGKWIINPDYDKAHPFSKGFASVKAGNKCGVINAKGDWVTKGVYSDVSYTGSNDCFIFSAGNKSGIVNIQGEELTPAAFDRFFSDAMKMQNGSMLPEN